jgi:hypothetical protein
MSNKKKTPMMDLISILDELAQIAKANNPTKIEFEIYTHCKQKAESLLPIERQELIDAHGIRKYYKDGGSEPIILTGEDYFTNTFNQ